MRRFLTILLSLTMAVSLHARGRALLIGIGDYPTESGWEKINASNDLKLLSKTLEGYQITTLQDSKATYNGIKAAFKKFTAECQTGDTVIIHFSCHGQQMFPAIKTFANEPDSLDESLIPYDAKNKYSFSYKGENHLRDNDFAKLINPIRAKVSDNGLVLVILDACHSDDLYKGTQDIESEPIIRGTRDIFGDIIPEEVDTYKYATQKFNIEMHTGLSHVVYISACKAHQVNRETVQNGIGYGSLSYAFCETYRVTGLNDFNLFAQQLNKKMQKIAAAQNLGVKASFVLRIETPIQQKETPVKKVSAVDRLLQIFK